MIPSSLPRRAFGAWFALHAMALLLLQGGAGLRAQEFSGEDMRGVWQIEAPEEGPVIVIVKKNNRASWFRGDGPDRTVYQGTWVETEGGIDMEWEIGGLLLRDATPTVQAIAVDKAGKERFRSVALFVPEEILGQWARPPEPDEDLRSDRDEAEGFFGLWEIGEEGAHTHVFVESDRSSASTWPDSPTGQRGLRGSWARQGSELHIAWDTGHYSILRETPRGYAYFRLDPGTEIEDHEEPTLPARRLREADIAPAWMAGYEAERSSENSGLAFSSRRNAQRFYRGDWLVQRDAETFERITIGRFGGLDTSRERSLDGEWRLSGQDLYMRWDDGTRSILGPVGDGFVLYEFRAGRPLDGIPTRVLAAIPADPGKLEKHLAGRADVGEQLRSLAEASGVEEPQKSAGWGRTFMRWAWPFGGDEEEAETVDAILEEEFETTDRTDPWWWPFWSEKSAPAAGEATDLPDGAEATGEEPAPQTETESGPSGEADEPDQPAATEKPEEAKKRPSGWFWPF